MNTPNIVYTLSGNPSITWSASAPEIDEQTYDFCHNFVIETALQLAEVDYDYDGWVRHHASQATEAPG